MLTCIYNSAFPSVLPPVDIRTTVMNVPKFDGTISFRHSHETPIWTFQRSNETPIIAPLIMLLMIYRVSLGRVVMNEPYFLSAFWRNLPKTRTKCGGYYYHVSWGCNARASDRIVKISGARGGHPLDRAAGRALTPRWAIVTRERLAISTTNLSRDNVV